MHTNVHNLTIPILKGYQNGKIVTAKNEGNRCKNS